MTIYLLNSDARNIPLSDQSVQCIITSPPYYGLRDYGIPNQIGLERTPQEYVASIVAVMRECWRVLKDDGVLWLNLGDSYASQGSDRTYGSYDGETGRGDAIGKRINGNGLKPKDLIGIPWRVAFALQSDGAASPETMQAVARIRAALLSDFDSWDAVPDKTRSVIEALDREWEDAHRGAWHLRSDIIWSKPNPMPESVTDRPTNAHEYIFLLTKRARYYYDGNSIRENGHGWNGSKFTDERDFLIRANTGKKEREEDNYRNRRSVWTVATTPYSGAKSLSDYVDEDGTPYIASPDCPIHGHLARVQKSYTVGYDGQSNQTLTRNAGNDNDHELERVSLQSAKTSHSESDDRAENAQPRNSESTDDYRSEANRLEYTLLAQTDGHTNRMLEHDEPSDHTSDLKRREYSLSAKGHNKRKNKTVRARRTSQHDTASEEIRGHTQSMLPIDGHLDSDVHIGESNSAEYDSSDDREIQTSFHNAHNESELKFFSAFADTSHMSLYCTCERVSIDHFATFPPKLIEPMVLASSRPGDMILDPFAGTATVGRVAIKHQRRFVGLDLNLKYIGDLAHERTSKVQIAIQFATEP